MDKLKQTLITWFSAKTESEQRLIKIAGPVFVLFLLITVVTKINTGVTSSQKKLTQQLELNLWAKQQIDIIKSADTNAGQSINERSVTQIINSTAKRFGVAVERIQPQKNEMVKVGINDIGFNDLMRWLVELQTKHNISAQNIDFSKADTNGMVKVRRLDLGRE
jgi:general secretion pathway protein M